jgi:hypothetical protein
MRGQASRRRQYAAVLAWVVVLPRRRATISAPHSVQFASFTVNDDVVRGGGTNSSLAGAGGRATAWAPPPTLFLYALATDRHNATADDRTTLTRSVESLI